MLAPGLCRLLLYGRGMRKQWICCRMASTSAQSSSILEGGMQRVGFIGLGNMGANMAANLLNAGYPLTVFDRNETAMASLQEQGARVAPSAIELSSDVDIVVTMLPSSHDVISVYLGPDGLLRPRSTFPKLFMDSSTVDPATCRKLAAAAAAAVAQSGASSPHVLDAPVSGGVVGAKAATLTFMVGGPLEGVEAAKGILTAMGSRSIHCGPSGTGCAAKLCNNLALAVQMAGVAEGLSLGQKLGLDVRLLSQIFNTSTARCWSSEVYNPVPGVMEGVPAKNSYAGGFANRLMAKDLQLALDAAAQTEGGAVVPMTTAVFKLYHQACEDGAAALDFSSIFLQTFKGEEVKGE